MWTGRQVPCHQSEGRTNPRSDYTQPMFKRWAGGSDGKASACNAGDLGSIPGSGRSPGEGNGYTLYYSCLENPTGQRGPADTVHEVTKSRHNWVTNPFISSITIEEHFPLVIYFFCLWLEIVLIKWPLFKSSIPELKKEKENLRCIEDGPAQLPGWGKGGRPEQGMRADVRAGSR